MPLISFEGVLKEISGMKWVNNHRHNYQRIIVLRRKWHCNYRRISSVSRRRPIEFQGIISSFLGCKIWVLPKLRDENLLPRPPVWYLFFSWFENKVKNNIKGKMRPKLNVMLTWCLRHDIVQWFSGTAVLILILDSLD